MVYGIILASFITATPTIDDVERALVQCVYPHEKDGWSYAHGQTHVALDTIYTLTIAHFPISAFTANKLPPDELTKLADLAQTMSRAINDESNGIRQCLLSKGFSPDAVALLRPRVLLSINGGGYSDAIEFDRSLLHAVQRSGITLSKEQERLYRNAKNDHERLGLLRTLMIERAFTYLFNGTQEHAWESIEFRTLGYTVHPQERQSGGVVRRTEVRIALQTHFPLMIAVPDPENVPWPEPEPDTQTAPSCPLPSCSPCFSLCPHGIIIHRVSVGLATPIVGAVAHVFGPSATTEAEISLCYDIPFFHLTASGIGAYHQLPDIGAWADIPPQYFWGWGIGARVDLFDVRLLHLERRASNNLHESNDTLFAGIAFTFMSNHFTARGGILMTRINATRQPNAYVELMYTVYQRTEEEPRENE